MASIVFVAVRGDQTRRLSVIFLDGSTAAGNLFRLDLGGSPIQLTRSLLGVGSFDVLPDGSKLVYAERDGETSRLWIVNLRQSTLPAELLFRCERALCSNPVWRPDGGAVVFDYVDLSTGQVLRLPRLWVIEMSTRQAKPLLDNQIVARAARWSPNGQWIAASDVSQNAILLVNRSTNQQYRVPIQGERFGEFSPNSQWLYFPRTVSASPAQTSTHLAVIELGDPPIPSAILPETDSANDVEAVWLPDSSGFIVARRAPFTPQSDPTTRLYHLTLEGDSTPLIPADAQPTGRQFGLRITPDGNRLLFRQSVMGKTTLSADLWALDLREGSLQRLAENVADARWLTEDLFR